VAHRHMANVHRPEQQKQPTVPQNPMSARQFVERLRVSQNRLVLD